MRRLPTLVCAACLVLWAGAARAGTLRGTVRNGTTGNPAAGVEVLLIQLQGGMETVANTKTDAQGQFTFEHPAAGQQPMLVRAVYRGVNFHQPAPPGRDTVTVDVFDTTRDTSILNYPTRYVVFQPNGASLLVGEEFTVQNDAKPPRAVFGADGNFEIEIPEKAELQQVAAWGPSGMPVTQATIDRGKNKYAIAYAFRPGRNGVRVSYVVDYAGNQAMVRLPAVYKAERLVLLAPPSVEIRADALQPSGNEQGMNVYVHDALASGKAYEVSVAGTAPPPSATSAAGEGQGQGQEGQGGGSETASVQTIPGRLDTLKWPVVAGFAALFALGAFFLLRKPVPAGVGASAGLEKRTATKAPRTQEPLQKASPAAQAPASMSEMDAAVNASLNALKEALFRLELRHQAGTISEEEYARERSRAEEMLRKLVRG